MTEVADIARPYRDLGNRAVSNSHSIGLTCHHCRVSWCGCAAECCCPECGAPKGYYPDDYDVCHCEQCRDYLNRSLGDEGSGPTKETKT